MPLLVLTHSLISLPVVTVTSTVDTNHAGPVSAAPRLAPVPIPKAPRSIDPRSGSA